MSERDKTIDATIMALQNENRPEVAKLLEQIYSQLTALRTEMDIIKTEAKALCKSIREDGLNYDEDALINLEDAISYEENRFEKEMDEYGPETAGG